MAYRIDNATAAETLPEIGPVGVTPNGYFQTRNSELGTPSTVLDSDWLNSYQEEVCSVIEGAGMTLDKSATDQLYQAIQTLISSSVNNVTPVLLKTISQTGHGFVKGDVLYHTGTNYAKARANSLASSWTVGMVYQVVSANTFKIVQIGYITGLSGLTVGANYLSVTTAGALTITQPAGTDTEVIKPCFIADSTTSGYFFNFAPVQAGSILDGVMLGANNLSDVVSASAARTNLGLGTASLASTSDFIASSDYTDFQQANVTLTAIADGVTPTADSMAYFTGATTASRTNLTSFGRSLIDDADAATARTTLGLVIGTNVQAYDADLAAIAGLTSAADSLPYFTGSGTAALTTFTSFARTLLDDTDAATMRATLGLVIGTNVQAVLSGASLTAVTVAADDKVLIQDTSDSNNLKSVTAQSIADLAGGGGSSDCVKIASNSNFTGNTLTITGLSSIYRKYELVFSFSNLGGAAGDVTAALSTDNGSTWQTNYDCIVDTDYTDQALKNGTATNTTYETSNAVIVPQSTAGGVDNNGNQQFAAGTITIIDPMNSAIQTTIHTEVTSHTRVSGTVYWTKSDIWAKRDAPEANNAIKITKNAFNTFGPMSYTLYGYTS